MSEEFGPTVLLTIGPPGQQMHAAARRVLETRPNPVAGRVWYDVNIQGNHLPQMYAMVEEIPLTGPIGAVHHGFCPLCLGWGMTVSMVSETGLRACSFCLGTGRLGLTQNVLHDGGMTEVSIQWDQKDMAQIACDLCREAFEVKNR